MAVKIRLTRKGKKNAPVYRIVVADGRSPRDGKFIEVIGMYNPRLKEEKIDLEKVEKWVKNGAQPSETVQAIIKRAQEGRKLEVAPAKNIQAPAPKVVEEAPAEVAEETEEAVAEAAE